METQAKQEAGGSGRSNLCSPMEGISCFACCPPIRPVGYDHLDFKPSLTRLFSENRAAFLKGAPIMAERGFFCAGLGFLDGPGETVGCLFHPARNRGVDLREATGYREKCARETCLPWRAFADLQAGEARALAQMCRGMDSFAFSSPKANPLMRLLAFGPHTARLVLAAAPAHLVDIARLPWLDAVPPAQGFALARLLEHGGVSPWDETINAEFNALLSGLKRRAGPGSPMAGGEPWHRLCRDAWEARFWRGLTAKAKAAPGELAGLRRALHAGLKAKSQVY